MNNSDNTILGHPAGLFTLFFTEMWERFSYYGMRALLVLFLVSDIADGGWEWTNAEALKLYGMYTGLVYLTPIFGGLLADKLIGFRKAVLLGAILMTAGHACMAIETPISFYIGLGLLIIGNGAFKPNVSSIVGGLYDQGSPKKDGAYTIFYMGINAGAFLGILLCGYVGEKLSWSHGFGLAGIFMFLGMVQFWFGQGIFGDIGLSPVKAAERLAEDEANGVVKVESTEEVVTPKVERDRLIVIGILAFFTIFFWMAFEQAGGSMTIFAKDFTDRELSGAGASIFKIVNAAITIVPLGIITWVLIMLFRKTYKDYKISVIALAISFSIIWWIAIWMLNKEFSADNAEVPASWFGVLNSLFIILLAPIFSKIWESKYNPSAAVKFGLGLILLGAGFGALAFGALPITGEGVVTVSMAWLIIAYALHTIGELILSPVGLSYVSKLSPKRLMSLMFGVWFLSSAVANYLAGLTGSLVDSISENYSLSTFFMIFTLLPAFAGLILIILNGWLKKKMHGIR